MVGLGLIRPGYGVERDGWEHHSKHGADNGHHFSRLGVMGRVRIGSSVPAPDQLPGDELAAAAGSTGVVCRCLKPSFL